MRFNFFQNAQNLILDSKNTIKKAAIVVGALGSVAKTG